MALLIDSYFNTREKIGHVFCVAKPICQCFIRRLRDAVGVISGRYDAVKFVRTELEKDTKFREEFSSISPDEIERIKREALDIVLQEQGKMDKFGNLKVKRNDLCPCGSGKKVKNCCGKV